MPTPPYQDPDNKKLVQGYAVDIFVEYHVHMGGNILM